MTQKDLAAFKALVQTYIVKHRHTTDPWERLKMEKKNDALDFLEVHGFHGDKAKDYLNQEYYLSSLPWNAATKPCRNSPSQPTMKMTATMNTQLSAMPSILQSVKERNLTSTRMTRNLTLQACALNIADNEKGDAAQNRAASLF